MEIGYSWYNSGPPSPVDLAAALEERGFGSLWVAEHSNLPYEAAPVNGQGLPLPDSYKRIRDPFVSLAMAATATTRLRLCTGMLLPLEREPVHLAKAVATLDQLSGGRVILGCGVGWNRRQHLNCAPAIPFERRFAAMRERVQALRRLWREDVVSYVGEWTRIRDTWVYPKPMQDPLPIVAGLQGSLGVRHTIEYADGWCPNDVKVPGAYPSGPGRPQRGAHDFDTTVARRVVDDFRARCEKADRDPSTVAIHMFTWDPDLRRLEFYRDLGVDSVVIMGMIVEDQSGAEDDLNVATMSYLDSYAPLIAQL